MFEKRKKVGLVLSGGATRGLSYIGVFQALKEYHIPVDFVAGTSAGALAGAFFCAGVGTEEMKNIAQSLTVKSIKTGLLSILPSKTDGIQSIIRSHLGDINIEDLPIPFCAVATDMKKGQEVDFFQGKLTPIVAGSCCVPGYFSAVEYEDYILMDGGLQNTIPSRIAKEQNCDVIIAVDINSTRGSGTNSAKLLDCLKASIGIILKTNAREGYRYADLVIQPDLKKFRATRLDGLEDMVQEGYNATVARIQEIKELIGKSTLNRYEKQKRKRDRRTDK